MNDFTNVQYAHGLRHGTRQAGSPGPPKHALACLPANLEELKQRITAALENVTKDMLQRVWHEFDYRLDVCRVTGGAHIEHL